VDEASDDVSARIDIGGGAAHSLSAVRSRRSGPSSSEGDTRVAVLARQPVVAIGVADFLDRFDRLHVVGATARVERVLPLLASYGVDVLVFWTSNYPVGEVRTILEGISDISAGGSDNVSTVCVVRASSPAVTVDLISLGASMVLTTGDSPQVLARAVVNAHYGSLYPSSDGRKLYSKLPQRPQLPSDADTLTPRELEVLQSMADGLSSRDIATQMGVSVNTVRTHVQRLMRKLDVHTRLRATSVAIEAGLVRPRLARRSPPRT